MSPVRPFAGGSSIPLSDQVIPGSKRPGFYRPITIPPWNRRRPPNRRPSIPTYKPLPHFPSDMVSLTSEKPMEDILTLDLGSHLSTTGEEDVKVSELDIDRSNVTESMDSTTDIALETSEIDREIMDFEKNKEKATKLEKYTSKTTVVTPTFNTETSLETDVSSVEEKTTASETSSTVIKSSQEIIPSNSKSEEIIPTVVNSFINESTLAVNTTEKTETILESSIQEIVQTLKDNALNSTSSLASTATEKLPDIANTLKFSSSDSKIEETTITSGTIQKIFDKDEIYLINYCLDLYLFIFNVYKYFRNK